MVPSWGVVQRAAGQAAGESGGKSGGGLRGLDGNADGVGGAVSGSREAWQKRSLVAEQLAVPSWGAAAAQSATGEVGGELLDSRADGGGAVRESKSIT